ncbi:MAG: DUF2147 domain-containing protein [Candidatus Competibacterales bacterium]
MNTLKLRSLFALGLIGTFAAGSALAGSAYGVWKTEKDDSGSYLEVTMAPCTSDTAKTCGTISAAYTKDGPDPAYVNLGKLIVKDMSPDGESKFSGGTIWDPEHDRVYASHMTVHGSELDVEGCISIICSGQHWSKAE